MLRTLATAIIFAISLFGAAGAADFPVTLDHQFGTTTIAAKPQRIVSIGMHEQDFLYALGIAPVGVHEWFGDYPYATWPWGRSGAQIRRRNARRYSRASRSISNGLQALKPDLIVATYYGDLDAETFALLSAIAPTITAPKALCRVGRALAGRTEAHRRRHRHLGQRCFHHRRHRGEICRRARRASRLRGQDGGCRLHAGWYGPDLQFGRHLAPLPDCPRVRHSGHL